MTKCAAYLTPHPDNVELAKELDEARNISVQQLLPKDGSPARKFDALVVNLDGWGPDMRATLVDRFSRCPLPCPVFIHSYCLDGQGEALQVKGIILCRRLEPELFTQLAAAVTWEAPAIEQGGATGKPRTLALFYAPAWPVLEPAAPWG
jgi:hypothetical protein